MLIGEKLGLYKAMAHAGPLTSQEVAERSGAAMGGFTRVRRATETPFNLILEARP
jgi:hypothetical protein